MEYTPRQPPEGINSSAEHPLKEAAILAAGAIAAVVLLVFLAGLLTDVAVHFVSRDTERALFGPLLDGLMKGQSDLKTGSPASEAQATLAALVDRVAATGPDLGYDWRVRIHCDETPNALAFPGGGVVFTSGLLKLLQSENELVFVIGHELGHFEHRDHLRGLGRGLTASLALSVVFAGAAVDGDQLLNGAAQAALAAHGREQEQAADLSGMRALQALYGHTGGASSTMKKLAQASDEGWLDRVDFLRSHPVGERRIAALGEQAAESGWVEAGEVVPMPAALTSACGS